MDGFMIRFMICNVFISIIIGILLMAKWLFKKSLSSRMQYDLWFLFLGLLAVPFIPLRPVGFMQVLSWLTSLKGFSASDSKTMIRGSVDTDPTITANWMKDLTLSVSSEAPSVIGLIFFGIWLVGIFAMIILVARSSLRLHRVEQSALPLQNLKVRRLYNQCLDEMKISKEIPLFSTAFLRSPIIVGLFRPRIYLPIHLISDYNEIDMRYMLLHELQHYKYKDTLANFIMNLAGVFYWFNPLIWYALKEMRNDREIACDTSVLKMLDESSYADYGNTLINFAEKVSLTPFPFASGLSGSMKQMEKRITNIASYKKPTLRSRLKGMSAFMLTAVLLVLISPILSTYAASENEYRWNTADEHISSVDLSAYFGDYKGCFVLYDKGMDSWSIYNMNQAVQRVAPDSTFKIYDALFGLEEGIITPENSLMKWNNEEYPFEAWESDHNLRTAMSNSVNWYFERIDKQIGSLALNTYIQRIRYGNEDLSGAFSSYWMESSLKISPVEQVKLLISMYHNSFEFDPKNIQAAKDSIWLADSINGTIYGKTGTGRVDGKDRNGWFIGFIETSNNTYFFASNIRADSEATGSKAADITLSVLSDKNIWK